jgi:hypothetical protein
MLAVFHIYVLVILRLTNKSSGANILDKYKKRLSQDIDYIKENGIEVFGITVKCNEELLYELLEMKIIQEVYLE